MWVPSKSKSISKNDVAIIKRDYQDLLFYDFPILFTGFNSLNDRIVGSFVENENGIESYLHSVVSAKIFSDFINQKINYPQLLERSQLLFLLHWTDEDIPAVYWLNYNEIPDDYLPDAQAFCPEINELPSFEYEIKFEGGLANNHQAIPETLSKFQNKFASFLRNPLGLSALASLILNVYLQAADDNEAYSASSLKIKYHVELDEKAHTLFHDADIYSLFLNKYIKYCLNNLSEDIPKLVEENNEDLGAFEELLKEYEKLIGQSKDTPERRRRDFAENMFQVAGKLGDMTSIIKDDFEQVVLSNFQDTDIIPLGVLDEKFGKEIEQAIQEVENKKGKKTIKEEDFNRYEIHIYDLNTDTRNGRAIMKPLEKDVKVIKPKFSISGNQPLTQTKYTKSLHLDTFIMVKARGTRTDGIIRDLEIEFEESDDVE